MTEPSLGITRTEFYVGDMATPILENDYPAPNPGGLYTADAGYAVMFDSAHFSNGQPVQVRLKVWTNDGGPYTNTWSAPVKNLASCFGRWDMDVFELTWSGSYSTGDEDWNGLHIACDAVESMNYELVRRISYYLWNSLELLPAVEDSNVLYIHTHGAVDHFWTDVNDYWISYPDPPTTAPENGYAMSVPTSDPGGFALYPSRVSGNGTSLPPINSTQNPPINLAFLDTCYTGTSNVFGEALLYPYGNIYVGTSSFPENQAEVGYNLPFKLEQFKACGEAFWGALMETNTVKEARDAVFEAYKGSNKPNTAEELMHVWGNFYTRLSGVYTGDNSVAPKGWYREISL